MEVNISSTILFLDTEFTELSRKSQLISLALLCEDSDDFFYAEFSEIEKGKCSQWIQENIITRLQFQNTKTFLNRTKNSVSIKNKKPAITTELKKWIKQFESVEIWADCLAYDWVLFCDLFGNARKLPENILYIPFDISTMLKLRNLNPDLDRLKYCEKIKGKKFITELMEKSNGQHNSLFDAFISREVYRK